MSGRKRSAYWIKPVVDRGRGRLHRALGIPLGEVIAREELQAAAKVPGKLGRQARLALTLRRLNSDRKRRRR